MILPGQSGRERSGEPALAGDSKMTTDGGSIPPGGASKAKEETTVRDELQKIEIALYRRAQMGRTLRVRRENQRLLDHAADYTLHLWSAVADRRAVRLRAR